MTGWAASESDDNTWPREIKIDQGVVVIYQPQPEKLLEDRLFARAAVALELNDRAAPVFGAVWFDARLITDKEKRIATFDDINISQVRFPDADKSKTQKFTALLEENIANQRLPIDLDNLLATLQDIEQRNTVADKLDNTAPKILFVTEPAVLISIDGKPHIQQEDGIERVINTPFTIVKEASDAYWYLNADEKTWYKSKDIIGQWQLADAVSKTIAALAPPVEDNADNAEQSDKLEESAVAPKIIVVTDSTELISSEGKLEFSPVSATDLLYVTNTDSDVLMDINNQQYYVLLSGRWYNSKSLEGPWVYIQADSLPEDFAKIPQDSPVATVRYAVPGTEEATEAVLDAQMPQTAVVTRDNTTLTVVYDGEPSFDAIEGTQLLYATNTVTPVLKYERHYYAVDEAVWFVADSPQGTWRVATTIPAEIYKIPPESPLYNVTFVRVYSYTPEVVYVGYTQGYSHVYVYHGTIVYGTGYWYGGWYGRYYYPRPRTWGFHVRYHPHGGWRFGMSYSTGPFTFSIGRGSWYRGGWWGPSRYRGYRHGYRHGHRSGYRAGYKAGKRSANSNNLYRSKTNQARTQNRSKSTSNSAKTNKASNISSSRPNNVYADKQGNVYRNSGNSWQQHTSSGWDNQSNKTQHSAKQQGYQTRAVESNSAGNRSSQGSTTRQSSSHQQQLNRSHQTRQRGNQRSAGGASRMGGGRQGGGRR